MLVSSLLADEKILSWGQKTQATPPRLNSVCVGAGISAHGLSPCSQLPGHTAAHTTDQHSRPEHPPCCKNPAPSQQLRVSHAIILPSRAFCSEVTSRQPWATSACCIVMGRLEEKVRLEEVSVQSLVFGIWEGRLGSVLYNSVLR